jgi:hypothetical protein
LALFDIQRVYHYLATFTFKRRLNPAAQVNLGRQLYCLGKKLVRQHKLEAVLAHFDPSDNQWVFLTEAGIELVRRRPKGLDAQTLTGLEPQPILCLQPIQLTLPFFVA